MCVVPSVSLDGRSVGDDASRYRRVVVTVLNVRELVLLSNGCEG